MKEYLESILQYFDVSEKHREKILKKVLAKARDTGIKDERKLYELIVEEHERVTTPVSEWNSVSLDDVISDETDRKYEEVVTLPDEEAAVEGLAVAELGEEYQSLLQQVKKLTTITVEDITVPSVASLEQIKERVAVLTQYESRLKSLKRPVKRIYFTEENELVIKLGKRRHGYDPWKEYEENYAGVSQQALRLIDSGLYKKLKKNGLLERLPNQQQIKKEIKIRRQKYQPYRKQGYDPILEYNLHYSGVTRYQLFLADAGLYNKLLKYKLIHHVPRSVRPKKDIGVVVNTEEPLKTKPEREKRPHNYDPLEVYNREYPGVIRSELRKLDAGLYQKLFRKDLLHRIPKVEHKEN